MFLAEPPQTNYDLHFNFFGVPVRVHPLFWLISLLYAAQGGNDGIPIVIGMAAMLVSILIHEMGHALAMQAYGWSSHIVLYSMGGLAIQDSPGRRDNISQILISLAGPFAGFALAATLVTGLIASGVRIEIHYGLPYVMYVAHAPLHSPNLNILVRDLLSFNIFWGIINLLPVFPLDGGQIARAMLDEINPGAGTRQSLALSIVVAGMVAYMAFSYNQTTAALLFAFLAFNNYQMLQAFGGSGRSGW